MYDYDRRAKPALPKPGDVVNASNHERLAMNGRGKPLKEELIEDSSVVVATYQAGNGTRKVHVVRRYYVVEWGLRRRHERSEEFDLKRDAMEFAHEKAASLRVSYAVGDTIEAIGYATGRDARMQALVKERKGVKDGKPGWAGVIVACKDARLEPGTEAWGFDWQVKRVV
jgi:hypothetical protein